ncbi:MAG: hypothetical protein IPK27_18855 [Rhodanobacteraceae bacterium]|nr:hypothetical protein [Rhodanobacteraceae bacterium]
MIGGDSDYALARLHARRASGIRAEDWRSLGKARETGAVIAQLRTSAAGRWVAHLADSADPHGIEAELRERFRERVREIAAWADPCWQGALHWCEGLVELRPLDAGDADPAPAWLGELRRRMPPLAGEDRNEFAWLLRALDGHRRAFAGMAAGNGWHLREELQHSLASRMGRKRLCAVHLLTAVALLWLEHERVRCELLRWAALPGARP